MRGRPKHILTGRRFERWLVLGIATKSETTGKYRWYCICDCGHVRPVEAPRLLNGGSKSCGCYHKDRITKHGLSPAGKPHPLCSTWTGMWTRCTNRNDKSFNRYGGRGITVCERWKRFDLFVQDIGPKPSPYHSIDRIDNDGNYEPGNVRWALPEVQQRNTRANRWLTAKGQTKCLQDWANSSGLSGGAIYRRLDILGWCVECAVTVPPYGDTCSHQGVSV